MIQRLFNLYNKAPDSKTTPTERFVSEGLAGLLESNPNFRRDFLKELCGLEISDAEVKTEASYPKEKSFIDIQIKNDSEIVFIEVKVDSSENKDQLAKYYELLSKLNVQDHYSNTHLIYLTRDYAKKPEINQVTHIYWSEVSELLEDYSNNNLLINSYLSFLNNLRLGPMKSLNSHDLEALKNYIDINQKIDAILSVMESVFTKKYGKPSSSTQLSDNKRIILYKKPVLTGEGWTELGLGLYFDTQPYIRAHIFVSNDNKNFTYFKDYANKIENQNFEGEIDRHISGISIGYKKYLNLLVNESSPRDKLTYFIKELFKRMEDIISDNPKLEWVIKAN